MKKLHKSFAALIGFVCIVLAMGWILKEHFSPVTVSNVELVFGDHLISYVLDDNEVMTFNLFGVQPLSKNGMDLSEFIKDVKFENPHIEILNFQLHTHYQHEKYQLFNLMVDVILNSKNIERTSTLIVQNFQGETKKYSIGEIVLTAKYQEFEEVFDIVNGEYTVLYPTSSLPFEVHLRNVSDETVVIHCIDDITGSLSYSKDIYVNSQKYQIINIRSFEGKKYDFYSFTPIIHFTTMGKSAKQVLPRVLYGAFIDETEMIEKILH